MSDQTPAGRDNPGGRDAPAGHDAPAGRGALAGRVALVTGGARGIGAAIVRGLHDHGAKVLIADCGTDIAGDGADPAIANALADELGEGAGAYTESIASPGSAQAAVAAAVERFGGLDILVNNAAILRDALIFKADPRNWDAVIQTNLSAVFYLCNAATPLLRQQAKDRRGATAPESAYDWGRIVNIVSTAGFYGNYGQVAYASAKAGLFGLTRVVALDMMRSGVTCNAVAPFAATRVTDMIQPANEAQAAYKQRALKLSPDHVARLVSYLATPAAQSVSGQLFGVRGREIFLFSQPRPVARIVDMDQDWQLPELAAAVQRDFTGQFAELATDLEAFNTEPVI
ncbi:MAG: SDR family NAD(P)-dependent oxidoreductase [Alphaproteobacteria bacterium]